MRPLTFILLLALLAACGDAARTPDKPTTPTADTTAPAPPLSRADGSAGTMDLAPLVDELLAGRVDEALRRLGQPRRVETTPQQNRHDATQTDTIRTYHYDGLALDLYDVTGSDGLLIQSMTATGARYRTAEGLHVGSSRDEVQAALGPPDGSEDMADYYELTPNAPTPNRLFIRYDDAQRVAWMRWAFYLD